MRIQVTLSLYREENNSSSVQKLANNVTLELLPGFFNLVRMTFDDGKVYNVKLGDLRKAVEIFESMCGR